jgi:hypothetical protein
MLISLLAKGDKKKAMDRLRGGWRTRKSHHAGTFWSGIFLGLAVPAFVQGLVLSKCPSLAHSHDHSWGGQGFQTDTREAIPGWDGLLYVYGIVLIPTLFACLTGLNLLVWANARINYVFIFGEPRDSYPSSNRSQRDCRVGCANAT